MLHNYTKFLRYMLNYRYSNITLSYPSGYEELVDDICKERTAELKQ